MGLELNFGYLFGLDSLSLNWTKFYDVKKLDEVEAEFPLGVTHKSKIWTWISLKVLNWSKATIPNCFLYVRWAGWSNLQVATLI